MLPHANFINVEDFHKHAQGKLARSIYDYYRSGAHDESTLKENVESFRHLRIRPRFLVDVSKIDLSTTILGRKYPSPIGVAPTAMHRMAHPDGEKATARGAAAKDALMILSSLSTTALEHVAESTPQTSEGKQQGIRWFQLYVYKDRELTRSLVSRAEKSGYEALVLTVDTPLLGRREADHRNNFALPDGLSLANFQAITHSSQYIVESRKEKGSGLENYVKNLFDPSLTWKDIAWLKSITKLPIIVKGVLTAEDALLAVEAGVAGIIVSNHGGRQLDTVSSTIEALPEVVKAVAGRAEVYLDGGIRRGTDVFKALALGAKAVFVGRPILWGLSTSGQAGVESILKILNDELYVAMQLAGCPTVAALNSSFVETGAPFLRAKL